MKKNSFGKQYNAVELFAVIAAITTIVAVIWLNDREKQEMETASKLASSSMQSGSSLQDGSNVPGIDRNPSQQFDVSNSLRLPSLIASQAGSIPAKDRVKFKIDHFKKLALQPLEFEILDEQKKPLTPENLKTADGQKVHFIVLSANFREFQHLNPTFEKGKWKTLANMPNPGTYYAYTQIAPTQGKPVVLRSDLIVRDPTQSPIDYPKVTEGLIAKANRSNFLASLKLTRPSLLQQTVLTFTVTSPESSALPPPTGSQQTQPLSQTTQPNPPPPDQAVLEPVFGGIGSVTLVRHLAPDSFMRIEPLASSNPMKNVAEFLTTFSESGHYTTFAEFKVGGRVRVFPFTFAIE